MASETVTISTTKTPGTSKSKAGFRIDTSELKGVAKQLRAADPALAKQLQLRLRGMGDIVAEEAEARAHFSTRIPGSIKVRVSGFTVKIVANTNGLADDAAPLENNGADGMFRHPVFGNTDVWVDQQSHPFLAPSLEAKADEIEVLAEAIITDTLTEVGLI